LDRKPNRACRYRAREWRPSTRAEGVLGEAHGDRLPDARAAAGDEHVLAAQAGEGGGACFGGHRVCHEVSPLNADSRCSRAGPRFVTCDTAVDRVARAWKEGADPAE